MKSRLSIATHVSVGLALITASLLALAHWVGLVPDATAGRLQARETVAELLSRIATEEGESGDLARVAESARALVAHNPDVVSVGVRSVDGGLVSSSDDHERHWQSESRLIPVPGHVRIPILRDGRPYADVELRFRDERARGLPGLLGDPVFLLVLFCVVAGFIAYRLYMRRVLCYLDPSSVIPERVRLVLDALAEGVMLLDRDGRLVLANRAFARMAGHGMEELIGQSASGFAWIDCTTNAPPIPYPWMETKEDGALRASLRMELRAHDGKVYRLSAACAPITAADGSRRGVVVTLADLTETERQRGALEELVRTLSETQAELARKNVDLVRLATTDALTLCLNRRALHERAEQYWAIAARRRAPAACIMIDVDHFKSVNDRHGHQTGDQVLRVVGGLLRDAARGQDLVGRYGGEEFCLILPDTDEAGARIFAERLREAMAEAEIHGLRITASLGVADNGCGDRSIEAAMGLADRALYHAKRTGRNRVAGAADLPPETLAA